MPLWYCSIGGCNQPAVRTLGDCILCGHHLCGIHAEADSHVCPRWENAEAYDPAAQEAERVEISTLLGRINLDALASRASELRGGLTCTVPQAEYIRSSRSSVMGGMNYHIELRFSDGVVWLARIRRFNATSPPPAVRDYILGSEYATYKFLERTAVPTPRVYDFALEGADNAVGVGYFLMEKMPGRSLRWSTLPEAERTAVMRQLADVFVELQRYPFDTMGSLNKAEPPLIEAFARESLLNLDAKVLQTLGPFKTTTQYHRTSINFVLDLILRGELYTNRAVDSYLIHLFLFDLVPQITSSRAKEEPFFLKHADDKGDHILIDEVGKITGIIDWEWAYTAPAALAFNSPLLLLPVADFYNGANDLGEQENQFAQIFEQKGNTDLAAIVRGGRIQHRFAFCCGYDLEDWSGFFSLFRGLRDAVNIDAGLDWEQWKLVALDRYKHDEGLRTLLAREESTVR